MNCFLCMGLPCLVVFLLAVSRLERPYRWLFGLGVPLAMVGAVVAHNVFSSLAPTMVRVERSELVGRWRLELHRGNGDEHYDPERTYLELADDGSFRLSNMPPVPLAVMLHDVRSGRGTWSTDGKKVRLEFSEVDGRPLSRYGTLEILSTFPPHNLWCYIGDPDNGEGMLFRKM